ncbi:MAG TPA: hypothetical protein PLF61_04250 [Candidatus Goldiibacteriota bacterium]|nr:hypothetical protein [Candidatus Goldiibacteriota bacterium]
MDEKDLIRKMRKAGRQEFLMPQNKNMIRNALIEEFEKGGFAFFKVAPIFAFIIVTAAVSIYMRIDYNEKQGSINDLGGIWCTYDDHYYGGNSIVWPPASTKGENNFIKSAPGFRGKGYAVRITGVSGTKQGLDFIGVNTFLSQHSTCPECVGINLTGFKGIKFKIKGEIKAGEVKFILPYEARAVDQDRGICKNLTSYGDYEADITRYITPEWKEVKLIFRKDLKQPQWVAKEKRIDIEKVLSDAKLIKWQYSRGQGQKIDLWIDDVEFF